jgi:Tfp pilus assembly protein PilW
MVVCRDESGFSLAELLVAFAVLALTLAAAATIHQTVLQAYVVGSNKTDAQQSARVALERIARDLRQTPSALTAATATSLTLVDQDTGVPVTYELTGDAPAAVVTRTMNGVADVLIGRVQTLTFAYRDVNNAVLAAPVAAPASVFWVDITVQTVTEDVAAAAGAASARAQMTTSIRLRNL